MRRSAVVHPSRFGQIAAVVVLGLSSMCLAAQAQVFSTPKNVSNNSDYSLAPQIAVDAAGNINVVWEDDTATNSNILFSRSTDGGVTFSTPKNVSSSTGFSSNPRISVDSQGAIDVVWVDNTPGNQDIFFSRSTDNGLTFSTPQNLSNDSADSGNPQMAVDATANINVVWENENITFGIFFSQSSDGGVTFSKPVNLTTNSTGSFSPQLAADSAGNINVVWEDDFSAQSDISFARSTGKGTTLTFSAPMNLSNNSGASVGAQIAVDSGGNINVTWMDNTTGNNQILFRRSPDQGATFLPAMNLSNGTYDSSNPQVRVGTNGSVYVVWQEIDPQSFNDAIFFARFNNGDTNFSIPTNISNNPGNSTNPWITVDATGAIDLNWLDTTPGRANVFFARSMDAGATFSTPQNVSNLGSSSNVHAVADKNGNLNVVWSDDAPVSGVGVNQILFGRFSAPKSTNQPPVANAGADQTLPATGPGGAPVTLDGSLSSDPDGDALTFVWTEGATVVGKSAVVSLTATMGAHTYTLTVTDAGGLSSTAVTHVTITNAPPVANAGADQTQPAAGPAGTPVTLNGSLSSDPDGDALCV